MSVSINAKVMDSVQDGGVCFITKLTFYVLSCPIDNVNSRLSPQLSLRISTHWVSFRSGTDKECKGEKYEWVGSLNCQGRVR